MFHPTVLASSVIMKSMAPMALIGKKGVIMNIY